MFLEMARPQKAGVEYFPLDVENDDKLDLIEAEFGLTGFAVVVKLYQRIYKFGYYCEWNDEVALLFGKRLGLGGSVVSEIVFAAIRRSLFDKSIYDSYGVLTSKGIQKRYLEIVARRKNVEMDQRYLLVSHTLIPDNVRIMHAETPVNGNIMYAETPVNGNTNAQSKVKESKGKESKVNVPDMDDLNAAASVPLHEYLIQNLFQMSPGNWQALHSLMEDGMTDELVRAAVDKATGRGIRGWSYVQSILNEWVVNNVRSLEDVKRMNEAHKRKQRGEKPSGRNDREPEIKPGENPIRRMRLERERKLRQNND